MLLIALISMVSASSYFHYNIYYWVFRKEFNNKVLIFSIASVLYLLNKQLYFLLLILIQMEGIFLKLILRNSKLDCLLYSFECFEILLLVLNSIPFSQKYSKSLMHFKSKFFNLILFLLQHLIINKAPFLLLFAYLL